MLETVDVYVPLNSTLEFSVTSTSSSPPQCGVTSHSQTGVFVQYSVNGGATWYLLEQIRPPATFRTIVLPLQAETKATRFRWYQPAARGDGLDKWAIDDVSIQTRSPITLPIADDFDPIRCCVVVYCITIVMILLTWLVSVLQYGDGTYNPSLKDIVDHLPQFNTFKFLLRVCL